MERVVARDDEASKVGEELATEIEDDEEEVESGDSNDDIRLRDTSLLLEVVQRRVLGELQSLGDSGRFRLAHLKQCKASHGDFGWARAQR